MENETMKFNLRMVLPRDPSRYFGFGWVRVVTAGYLALIVGRSLIHLFAPDGGAQSIASIDVSVEGGGNLIALFHQWGASQLLLALALWVLFFRYPGLTPLILLVLVVEPTLRALAGAIMPVTSTGTPPGADLNWVAFYLVAVVFLTSLIERRQLNQS